MRLSASRAPSPNHILLSINAQSTAALGHGCEGILETTSKSPNLETFFATKVTFFFFLQGVSVSKLHFNFLSTSALKQLESHKNPSSVFYIRLFFFFWGRPASRQE